MCNISSWFSSSKKKKRAQAAAQAAQKAREEAERKARAEGAFEQETATNAQVNKSNDKTITSLRVPVSTEGTGGNVDTNKRLGLNLLG